MYEYILIPNEKEKTYEFVFEKLKTDFLLNPFIIALDYAKAINIALKNHFPDSIQIKFFSFYAFYNKKYKKLILFTKNNYILN